MSTHAKKPLIAGPQSVDIKTSADRGEELSAKTAARLRDICDRTSEPYDNSLSETQALRRIAALEEVHGV